MGGLGTLGVVDGEIRLENRRMAETSYQTDLLEAVEEDLDAI